MKILIPKNLLVQRYCQDGLSLLQVANQFGCSQNTVLRRLSEFGIERRQSGPQPDKPNPKKKITISKELLESYYHDDNLTFEKIGEILGCSGTAISVYAKRIGIVSRSLSKGHGD